MKRGFVIAVLALVSLCVLGVIGWVAAMRTINTQKTEVQVWVAAQVEEVRIYQDADPLHAVAVIETQGEEASQTLALPSARAEVWLFQSPPALYYFVATTGEEEYRSRAFCCSTGLMQERLSLEIYGLGDWEVRDQ